MVTNEIKLKIHEESDMFDPLRPGSGADFGGRELLSDPPRPELYHVKKTYERASKAEIIIDVTGSAEE